MGSPCELRLPAAVSRQVVEACIDEIEKYEARYSRYRADSLVSRINSSAGGEPIEIDPETAEILNYANVCYELSDGVFDITSGVLRRIWHTDRRTLPDDADLQNVLALVGWQQVERGDGWIRLPLVGMEIDLGGVVKEYVADALVTLLRARGIKSGLINLGGDIAIVGPQPNGSPWEIGIAHPDDPARAIAAIELVGGAITTSGGYERYIEIDGERHSHLLNPKTGWPVQGLAGVTVIAEQAVVAGTISTLALLKDQLRAKRWLEESGAAYLAVSVDGTVSGTIVATLPAPSVA